MLIIIVFFFEIKTLNNINIKFFETTINIIIIINLNIATTMRERNKIIVLIVLNYDIKLFFFIKAKF